LHTANKFKNVSDYSKYLTNKYKCLTPCKNASVLIDGSVMRKACGDEKTAKWLEGMKEDKEKEDKKTENMIAIEATIKNKVGFDTYA